MSQRTTSTKAPWVSFTFEATSPASTDTPTPQVQRPVPPHHHPSTRPVFRVGRASPRAIQSPNPRQQVGRFVSQLTPAGHPTQNRHPPIAPPINSRTKATNHQKNRALHPQLALEPISRPEYISNQAKADTANQTVASAIGVRKQPRSFDDHGPVTASHAKTDKTISHTRRWWGPRQTQGEPGAPFSPSAAACHHPTTWPVFQVERASPRAIPSTISQLPTTNYPPSSGLFNPAASRWITCV